METLTELLREADPVALEPSRTEHHRVVRRERILRAAAAHAPIQPRRTYLGVAGLAIIAFAAGGGGFWWARATADLLAAVRFEVHLAEDSAAPGLLVATIADSGRLIYMHPDVVVGNSDIAGARVVDGGAPSTYGVAVSLTPDGAAQLRRATATHIDRPVAIVIDGAVVMAPRVRSAIDSAAIVSGSYTQSEAERVVAGIIGR